MDERAWKEAREYAKGEDTLPRKRPGVSGRTHPVCERDAGMVHPRREQRALAHARRHKDEARRAQLTGARVQRRLVRGLVVHALDDVDLACGCRRGRRQRKSASSENHAEGGGVGPWDAWCGTRTVVGPVAADLPHRGPRPAKCPRMSATADLARHTARYGRVYARAALRHVSDIKSNAIVGQLSEESSNGLHCNMCGVDFVRSDSDGISSNTTCTQNGLEIRT